MRKRATAYRHRYRGLARETDTNHSAVSKHPFLSFIYSCVQALVCSVINRSIRLYKYILYILYQRVQYIVLGDQYTYPPYMWILLLGAS